MVELRTVTERDILALRGPRNPVDSSRPYLWFTERERTTEGRIEEVAAIFLTNKECPFRCVFCDLWKNTTKDRVPPGAVAGQVDFALAQSPGARHIKLYNSGNFFDDQAVSQCDRLRIRDVLSGFRTVIVECHPKLVDRRCVEFAGGLAAALQVGMGLETVDPHVLPRLNKRMTLDDFARATEFLLAHGIAVRAFIMLRTPYQSEEEGVEWAQRSIDFAFSIGVECCSVVPARTGVHGFVGLGAVLHVWGVRTGARRAIGGDQPFANRAPAHFMRLRFVVRSEGNADKRPDAKFVQISRPAAQGPWGWRRGHL